MSDVSPTTITLTRPDDWHLHLRDGEVLAAVLPATCRQMGRAIIMPNLKPAITTVDAAYDYRQRILAQLAPASGFTPLMTLYLTDASSSDEMRRARESGFIHGIKLYPAGATTHSDAGVTSIDKIMPVLEVLSDIGLPLLLHGEVTDPAIDVFDREAVFIEQVLEPLRQRLPSLRVVLEHITTHQAVQYVMSAGDNVAATITAHHLLMNRNALFTGGLRPHHYCLPLLKREEHRQSLLSAATSGLPCFFLGTDSAPHARSAKQDACGCAGVYTAHAAIELYAEAFESVGALDRLEAFASFHGADFYRLPRNSDSVTLQKSRWIVPACLAYSQEELVPFRAEEAIQWRFIAPGD